MESRNRWTIVGLILVPLAFLFLIALLWLLDFFEFSGTEASAKIVGTALTLGGGLVATMVTLIGLILRQSVEQRNADLREEAEKRLSLDAERNKALQEEAERRLKLEAAIRAVDLLGTDTGGDTNLLQRTGALFSLSRLGLSDLAIDLVHFMRPDNLIEIGPTSSLLDIALRSSNPNTQIKAAEFLRDHPKLLLTKEGLNWPDYITLTWPQELDFLARDCALEGLMKAILARPRNEWNEGRLNGCVVRLVVAFRAEQDPRLRANVALFLRNLLKIYPKGQIIYLPDENLDIDTLRQQLTDTDVNIARPTDSVVLLTDNLKNWMGD